MINRIESLELIIKRTEEKMAELSNNINEALQANFDNDPGVPGLGFVADIDCEVLVDIGDMAQEYIDCRKYKYKMANLLRQEKMALLLEG